MSSITLTKDMNHALNMILKSSEHVFITGKAGTGKTTFLRYIADKMHGKRMVITASTGIAAVNAGGVTLHSLFRIPMGVISPTSAVKGSLMPLTEQLLKKLDILVIDEVSMVRPDVLDFIDRRLQKVRLSRRPFGGVQLVMFGDLYQLPPVVRPDEKHLLDEFYEDCFFFNARTFQRKGFKVVELGNIFRQTDRRFIELLNNVRTYTPTAEDLHLLASLPNRLTSYEDKDKYIHICTHKSKVESINRDKLGTPTHTFESVIKKDFNLSHAPCDQVLQLRVGARVMTLVNKRDDGYVNGSLGVITGISQNAIDVLLDNGTEVSVERFKWESCEYELVGDEIKKKVKGTCTQFPLTLAWAVTIHKSQGLQFNRVAIHSKGAFCSGQVYVALSRCTSLDGIVCDSVITEKQIIPAPSLIEFERCYKAHDNYYGLSQLSFSAF